MILREMINKQTKEKKRVCKKMGKLNETQRYGVIVLVILGLLFAFVALIHLFLAILSYKRKAKFLSSFLIAAMFLFLGACLIQE
jgi:hypothetical protein